MLRCLAIFVGIAGFSTYPAIALVSPPIAVNPTASLDTQMIIGIDIHESGSPDWQEVRPQRVAFLEEQLLQLLI
jgi:hypothetical protein